MSGTIDARAWQQESGRCSFTVKDEELRAARILRHLFGPGLSFKRFVQAGSGSFQRVKTRVVWICLFFVEEVEKDKGCKDWEPTAITPSVCHIALQFSGTHAGEDVCGHLWVCETHKAYA